MDEKRLAQIRTWASEKTTAYAGLSWKEIRILKAAPELVAEIDRLRQCSGENAMPNLTNAQRLALADWPRFALLAEIGELAVDAATKLEVYRAAISLPRAQELIAADKMLAEEIAAYRNRDASPE